MSREAFGLKSTDESITNDILNVIISHGYDGVCRQVLFAWDPKKLEKWGYNIYNNNYDNLARRSKWFKKHLWMKIMDLLYLPQEIAHGKKSLQKCLS